MSKNANGKTPFVIAIEKGSLKCVRYILSSKWLHRNVDIGDFINADSLKTAIDKDQAEIAAYFVSDTRRFAAIIQIKIRVQHRSYNVLEYAIALKKPDFVRIFISVRIPAEERELYSAYKYFLKHYNAPSPGSSYDQTPIQRMLLMVKSSSEGFVRETTVDLLGRNGATRAVITGTICRRRRRRPVGCRRLPTRSSVLQSLHLRSFEALRLVRLAQTAPTLAHRRSEPRTRLRS